MAFSSFALVTGKEPDPSGNGYTDTVRDVDLCKDCMDKIVADYFEKNPIR